MYFCGTGESDMEHYHGLEEFLTFSKVCPVFRQSRWRALDLMMPAYSARAHKLIDFVFRLKS